MVAPGETLVAPDGAEYRDLQPIGEGTYGRVFRAERNGDRQKLLAIKFVNVDMAKFGEREARILGELTESQQKDGLKYCVFLEDSFVQPDAYCIVMELLGPTLGELLKYCVLVRNRIPMFHVQNFSMQILRALEFVHSHRVIHTDMKPDNIMFANYDLDKLCSTLRMRDQRRMGYPELRLIDFGCYRRTERKDRETGKIITKHTGEVTTLWWRAPEVSLGLGWSYSCDLFSTGVILVELITKHALFRGVSTDCELLTIMEKILGKLPEDLLEQSQQTRQLQTFKQQMAINPEFVALYDTRKRLEGMLTSKPDYTEEMLSDFTRFVKTLLNYWPDKRPTCTEALQNKFLTNDWEEEEEEEDIRAMC